MLKGHIILDFNIAYLCEKIADDSEKGLIVG